MAKLTGQTIAGSYDQLLIVDHADGISSSLQAIESADTGGSASALQISTTSICVDNPTASAADQGGLLRLQCDDGAVMASGDRLGVIQFCGAEDTNNTITVGASIEGVASETWDGSNNGARLDFFTTPGNNDPTRRMTILADGYVGIGTASPQTTLHIAADAAVPIITLYQDAGSSMSNVVLGAINFGGDDDGSGGADYDAASIRATLPAALGGVDAWTGAADHPTSIEFWNTPDASASLTQRMTIYHNGYVGIGTTPSNTLHVVTPLGASAADLQIAHFNHTTSTDGSCLGIKVEFSAADPDDGAQTFIHCLDSAGNRFLCYSNGELWQAAGGSTIDSDERLKENIVDATSKLDDINKLKVRNFNLRKTDKETGQVLQKGEMASRKRIGFIAQELEEIFPSLIKDHETISAREAVEAVTAKDAVLDSDGNIVEEAIKAVEAVTERKQLIRKSLKIDVLVPMLVKAVQELSAKVEALENNNNQGDSSNEQEQEEPDSGASNGESAGEDSGGVEADSSDSSDTASGASEVSDPSSDDGDQSSGSSGSDSSDDSEGGSGGDDSSGSEGE